MCESNRQQYAIWDKNYDFQNFNSVNKEKGPRQIWTHDLMFTSLITQTTEPWRWYMYNQIDGYKQFHVSYKSPPCDIG